MKDVGGEGVAADWSAFQRSTDKHSKHIWPFSLYSPYLLPVFVLYMAFEIGPQNLLSAFYGQ